MRVATIKNIKKYDFLKISSNDFGKKKKTAEQK